MSVAGTKLKGFEKQKLLKSHNETKLMRIKIESKMNRLASPITQTNIEIKEYVPQKKNVYDNYLKSVKERENRHASQSIKTNILTKNYNSVEKKISSIRTFIPINTKVPRQPSLRTFKEKYNTDTSITDMMERSVEVKSSLNVKLELRSPSKEIKEYNDRKSGILNNSLRIYNERYTPSSVLRPDKLTSTKICSIKIVKAYPNKKQSIVDLLQNSQDNYKQDTVSSKINNDDFKSKIKSKSTANFKLREKYKNRNNKYLNSNANISIF